MSNKQNPKPFRRTASTACRRTARKSNVAGDRRCLAAQGRQGLQSLLRRPSARRRADRPSRGDGQEGGRAISALPQSPRVSRLALTGRAEIAFFISNFPHGAATDAAGRAAVAAAPFFPLRDAVQFKTTTEKKKVQRSEVMGEFERVIFQRDKTTKSQRVEPLRGGPGFSVAGRRSIQEEHKRRRRKRRMRLRRSDSFGFEIERLRSHVFRSARKNGLHGRNFGRVRQPRTRCPAARKQNGLTFLHRCKTLGPIDRPLHVLPAFLESARCRRLRTHRRGLAAARGFEPIETLAR